MFSEGPVTIRFVSEKGLEAPQRFSLRGRRQPNEEATAVRPAKQDRCMHWGGGTSGQGWEG